MSNNHTIRTVSNTIYFYAPFNNETNALLNMQLRELDNNLKASAAQYAVDPPNIHLRICSYGGSILSALSSIDTIRSLKCKVDTYIEGGAASAATLLSVTGNKRYMGKHSMLLIHQLSAVNAGTFSQMEDGMENNKKFMEVIKDLYKKYTKIPTKELTQILKRDIWFDAETSLKYGLIDEIF